MQDLDVCDPWRRKYPNKSDFSCFSPSTKSYSCIDKFLLSNCIFPQIYDVTYESIVILDHGPGKLTYNMPRLIKGPHTWRLHPKWLHDTKFIKFVGTSIDEFFNINTNETTAAAVRWEAFKAYLRGQMISYTSYYHKVNLKLKLLEDKIRNLKKEK